MLQITIITVEKSFQTVNKFPSFFPSYDLKRPLHGHNPKRLPPPFCKTPQKVDRFIQLLNQSIQLFTLFCEAISCFAKLLSRSGEYCCSTPWNTQISCIRISRLFYFKSIYIKINCITLFSTKTNL